MFVIFLFFLNNPGIHRAMKDLDWAPKYDSAEAIFKDAYENDFVHVKAAGKLKNDFVCDDIVLMQAKGGVVA